MAKSKRTKDKLLKIDDDLDKALMRLVNTDPPEIKSEIANNVEGKVRLVERDDAGHPILIYASPKGINVDLAVRDGSLWATQKQMGEMFGVTRENITAHLSNIFREGELVENSVCKESLLTATDGKKYKTKLYDLNAMISVGYRVGSMPGTMFRMWATDKLFQILTKGFYVDVERLKNQGEPDTLDQFREIAREIRTSIRNSYREVLRLCALCSDYDGKSETAREFFMEMENKLLWAASGKTAPQLILERCDAEKDDIGLLYFSGKRGPTQNDVKIGNNYLVRAEAERKNRITEMWLSYIEEQLDQGRLPTMAAVRDKLTSFIKFNQWSLLTDLGRYSRVNANAHALEQLELYRERMQADAEMGTVLGKKS
jgi:hypothetical protein